MVHMRPAVLYIGLEVLSNIASRREFIKNFCLELGKEIKNFFSFFSGKIFYPAVYVPLGNDEQVSWRQPRITE